jgi:hypothetical protein
MKESDSMKYRATLYRTIVHAVEIEFEGPVNYAAAFDEALAIAKREGASMIFKERFPAEYEVLDLREVRE